MRAGACSEQRARWSSKTGSEAFAFEFRGGDKAQRAYMLILQEVIEAEPS